MKKIGLFLAAILLPSLAFGDVTVTMEVKMSGMMGMVDTDSYHKIYYKADKTRVEAVSRAMPKGMAKQVQQVVITRFDKGVIWLLDDKDSAYSEIKIGEISEDSSAVDMTIKDLKVTNTDNKRNIAGYQCREAKVEFTVLIRSEDSAVGQKVRGSFWVATKEDNKLKALSELWQKMPRTAEMSLGGESGMFSRQIRHLEKELGGVVLASEVFVEMAIGDEQAEDEYKEAMQMMKQFMGGESSKEQAEESSSGMKFTTEVTSISTEKLSDNLFEIPKGYKKIN
ncbi:MAG: DUF4412 domain-containing protein [bacterium]